MTEVKQGDSVQVRYTARLDDGNVIESIGTEGAPFQLTIGQGTVIPGLEQALLGMHPGDSKVVKVPPEMAFGSYREGLAIEVQRETFTRKGIEPQEGMEVVAKKSEGDEVRMRVTQVSDALVKLDSNHPLAGKDLVLEIELLAIV